VEDLHDLYASRKVLIIDTRVKDAYDQEHIKGSIFRSGKRFCRQDGHSAARQENRRLLYLTVRTHERRGGAQLEKQGFDNAAALLGGLEAWKRAGYLVTVRLALFAPIEHHRARSNKRVSSSKRIEPIHRQQSKRPARRKS